MAGMYLSRPRPPPEAARSPPPPHSGLDTALRMGREAGAPAASNKHVYVKRVVGVSLNGSISGGPERVRWGQQARCEEVVLW